MNSLKGNPELPGGTDINISADTKQSDQEQTSEVKNSSQKSSGVNAFGHRIVKEADVEGIGSKMQHKLWRGKSDEQNSLKNIPAQERSSIELSSEALPVLDSSRIRASWGSCSPQLERKSSGIFASRLSRDRSGSEASARSSPIFSRKSVSNAQEETDRQVDLDQGLKNRGLRVRYLKFENAYKIDGSHMRFLNGLETLDLTNCDQFDWKMLEGLDEVKNLILKGCKIEDEHLEFFRGMKKLETLDLTGCHVTDKGLAKLPNLPRLHSLNLSDCQSISPQIGDTLKFFPLLRTFNVTGWWKFAAVKEKVFFPGIKLIQ